MSREPLVDEIHAVFQTGLATLETQLAALATTPLGAALEAFIREHEYCGEVENSRLEAEP